MMTRAKSDWAPPRKQASGVLCVRRSELSEAQPRVEKRQRLVPPPPPPPPPPGHPASRPANMGMRFVSASSHHADEMKLGELGADSNGRAGAGGMASGEVNETSSVAQRMMASMGHVMGRGLGKEEQERDADATPSRPTASRPVPASSPPTSHRTNPDPIPCPSCPTPPHPTLLHPIPCHPTPPRPTPPRPTSLRPAHCTRLRAKSSTFCICGGRFSLSSFFIFSPSCLK